MAAPQTRSEWVDCRLREQILDARRRPGDPLVTTTIAEELGVSATPVREALRRLASEGLVELVPHGAARVAPVSVTEAIEIYELRVLVEPKALHRSVVAGDDRWRRKVADAFQRMVDATPPGSHRVHAGLHDALLTACDNTWLMRTVELYTTQSRRFLATVHDSAAIEIDMVDEHRPLVDLALAGRADAAADELAAHLGRSADRIRALLARPSPT
ncbi:MAG: GntR family transcriptional regulator [Acidimicrobiia bacterium]|nr:GntR family transcriptional regulator [Acidimicrobiia bacterium]MDH5236028.1 GntR family transcriptional regulator [Acidimicrobiia bacterium]